ncbi:hypothetical protein D3C73_1505300 [compost metagenome]
MVLDHGRGRQTIRAIHQVVPGNLDPQREHSRARIDGLDLVYAIAAEVQENGALV